MPVSMHSASAPIFTRSLTNMLTWLDKAEEYAKDRDFDANNFLGQRLSPDMMPFTRQIQIATDTAKSSLARISGTTPPKWADDENSIEELRDRIRKAIDYVQSISTTQIDGRDESQVLMPAGADLTLTFTGQAFLTSFALPNFFFHVSMAYALLRQAGVNLGKMDYLGPLETSEAD